MRHRKQGRRLGRSSSHRRALLRNLASSLFLTERDADDQENPPKVPGRITTTLQKAKEVRPLVEKCITIARRSLQHEENAKQWAIDAPRGADQWREWRNSQQWVQWAQARAPAVAARRRAVRLLRDKEAVRVLFDVIAPRMADRDGGYTRILRLATPRVGDAGARAILELVGRRDREELQSEKPAFSDEEIAESPEEEKEEKAEQEKAEQQEEEKGEQEQGEPEEQGGQEEAPEEDVAKSAEGSEGPPEGGQGEARRDEQGPPSS